MYIQRPLIAAMLAAGLLAACGGDDAPPTADQQASDLLAKMTLDEKIQLVHGAGYGLPEALGGAGVVKGIPRLGIPDLTNADSAGGVNVVGSNATPYPAPIALAASWDPALAHSYGSGIATELRTLGFAEGLGGGVNLAREPRNGRTFEYMGEDPVLAGNMIAQRTLGTQSQKVIATIKHYAGNEQETNRWAGSNSVIDERTLRELYLLPFEIGVKDGAPGNVMCAYNLVNGLQACESPYLLTDVLKTEWGFKGIVQSDWFFAVTDTVRAANAGLDEEEAGAADDSVGANLGGFQLPVTYFNQKLKAAVQAGTVPMARLNDMVQRKLRTLYASGVMASPPKAGGSIDQAAGNVAAQKVAEQSIVLLKNATPTGGTASVLPLSATAAQTIVVIGGHADAGVISGGGSGAVPARDGNAVTCLVPGAGLFSTCATWYKSSPLAAIKALAPNATVTYLDGSDAAAAATAAAAADVAIVFATQWQTEGADLPNLSLPNNAADPANQAYDQNGLITAVAAVAKRSVVVLETGTAVTMPWLGNVNAVLEAWYPGVQGGPAIANVLFG
ncbi:MAG: glycoside hydrolase family 3 N-terminal domain-containing protein, partial [Rhodoferax sp.]